MADSGWAVWPGQENEQPAALAKPVIIPDTIKPAAPAFTVEHDPDNPDDMASWRDTIFQRYTHREGDRLNDTRTFIGIIEDQLADDRRQWRQLWDSSPEGSPWWQYMRSDDGIALTVFRLQARSFLNLTAGADRLMADTYEQDLHTAMEFAVDKWQPTIDAHDQYRANPSPKTSDAYENAIIQLLDGLAIQMAGPMSWTGTNMKDELVGMIRTLENESGMPKAVDMPRIPVFEYTDPNDIPANQRNMRAQVARLKWQLTDPNAYRGLEFSDWKGEPADYRTWTLPQDQPDHQLLNISDVAFPKPEPITLNVDDWPREHRGFENARQASNLMDAIADDWHEDRVNAGDLNELFEWLEDHVCDFDQIPDDPASSCGAWGSDWVRWLRSPDGMAFADYYGKATAFLECVRLFTKGMGEARKRDLFRLSGLWAFEQAEFHDALLNYDGSRGAHQAFHEAYVHVLDQVNEALPAATCWMPFREDDVKRIMNVALTAREQHPKITDLPDIPSYIPVDDATIPDVASSMREYAAHLRDLMSQYGTDLEDDAPEAAAAPPAIASNPVRQPEPVHAEPYEYAPEPPMPDDYGLDEPAYDPYDAHPEANRPDDGDDFGKVITIPGL